MTTTLATATQVRQVLAGVPDPEIPVISIEDLGILRDVEVAADGAITVTVTPTYSGCPAMDEIRADITSALHAHPRLHEQHPQEKGRSCSPNPRRCIILS